MKSRTYETSRVVPSRSTLCQYIGLELIVHCIMMDGCAAWYLYVTGPAWTPRPRLRSCWPCGCGRPARVVPSCPRCCRFALVSHAVDRGLRLIERCHGRSCLPTVVRGGRLASSCCVLQPIPEVYNLFDQVVLLQDGYSVYSGPREGEGRPRDARRSSLCMAWCGVVWLRVVWPLVVWYRGRCRSDVEVCYRSDGWR